MKHDRVGTGEILVGLLVWAETSDGADNALAEAIDSKSEKAEKFRMNFAAFNLTAAKVRAEVKRITGSGAGERASAYSFTPGAELLLLLAYEEALNLCTRPGTEKVEPEHLLLALLRQDEGVACRILERLGLDDFSQLRSAVLSSLEVNQEELLEIRFERARRQGAKMQSVADDSPESSASVAPKDRALLATAEKLLEDGLQSGASFTDLPIRLMPLSYSNRPKKLLLPMVMMSSAVDICFLPLCRCIRGFPLELWLSVALSAIKLMKNCLTSSAPALVCRQILLWP